MTTNSITRLGYLNLPQPDLLPEPRIRVYRKDSGEVMGAIYLSGEMNMHIDSAAAARTLALAFGRLAEDMARAEAGEPVPELGR